MEDHSAKYLEVSAIFKSVKVIKPDKESLRN